MQNPDLMRLAFDAFQIGSLIDRFFKPTEAIHEYSQLS